VNFARSRRADVVVDVTPLIDIIFQLVLFFMVSTTFVTSPGIEVDLPRSSSDTILRERDDINLWVTSEGAVYLDDAPVDWPMLQGALERAAATNPSTLIIIKADRDVDHGRVVAVMDLARSLGLNRLAIATEVNSGEQSESSSD
jgi:biopolymer transport protein ExbD